VLVAALLTVKQVSAIRQSISRGAGYIVLAQDIRGRCAAQGRFYAFVNEGKDGC